jgi:hypothetical protein
MSAFLVGSPLWKKKMVSLVWRQPGRAALLLPRLRLEDQLAFLELDGHAGVVGDFA